MAFRFRPVARPVEIVHDGDRLVAERDEPIAAALIASDRLLLARSPKLHRPRGPYCFRGACDGCLARVNGVPNVMTCLRPATGGEQVETQNVLGTRGADALRAADFLFPRGFDHHRLLAGVRVASSVLQTFARKVAGLGRLPDVAEPIRNGSQRAVDVLVVGGGRAGLDIASRLGALRPLVCEDAVDAGGSLLATDPDGARRLAERAANAGAEVWSSTTVAGLYAEEKPDTDAIRALLVGPDGATLAKARAVVVAAGTHAPVALFGNNDLPGVFSARAAARLSHLGIAVGRRAALVGPNRYGDAATRALDGHTIVTRVAANQLVRAIGRRRVTGLATGTVEGGDKITVDAVLVDGPGEPAVELAVQGGGRVEFDPTGGYRIEADESGRVAERVWCAGSCRTPSGGSADRAELTAASVEAFLG